MAGAAGVAGMGWTGVLAVATGAATCEVNTGHCSGAVAAGATAGAANVGHDAGAGGAIVGAAKVVAIGMAIGGAAVVVGRGTVEAGSVCSPAMAANPDNADSVSCRNAA